MAIRAVKKGGLSKAAAAKYVDNYGASCPFCDSDDIGVLDPPDQVDCGIVKAVIECRECEQAWRETYHLKDVEEYTV